MAYSKTIVTKVYDGKFIASDFVNFGLHPAVGRMAYGLSSYQWAGLDGQTGDPQGYLDGVISKDYAAIFKDSVDNQIFHGSSVPLYSGYLGNSLRWRNLSLSANITYRLSFYFRQRALGYTNIFNGLNLHADYANRWQQPGDEVWTTVPSMIYPIPSVVAQRESFYSGSEIHVKRGDNIRFQDVRLSYDLSRNTLNKLGLSSVQIYLYANNLNVVLWKINKGKLDADYTSTVSTGGPTPKIWTMGLILGI